MTMVLAQTPKRRPSAHERKRHGQHHKHTKHYSKPYWPYLPLLVVVIVGFIGNTWLGREQRVLGASTNFTASALLQDTNEQRQNSHEQPLALNAQLASAAQTKADDMATHDYWSHDTPDGKTPWTFIQRSGYQYQTAGENLAYGFANSAAVTAGWMNSAEHRANILNASYQNVGFGLAMASRYQGHGRETIIVAMYAAPATSDVTSAVLGDHTNLPSNQYVARVQVLTAGSAPWSLVVAILLTAVTAALFVLRHSLMLRRAVVRSEAFVIKHPLFDILLVSVATLGFMLTRSSGFIQ